VTEAAPAAKAPASTKPNPTKLSLRVDSMHVRQCGGDFDWTGEVVPVMAPRFDMPNAHGAISADHVFVLVHFKMDILHTKEDDGTKPPIFTCSSTYVVQYNIRAGDPVGEEDLQAFARMNGPYTCYPYWREYLNASLSRAGLPFMSLPPWLGGKMAALPFPAESARAVSDQLATSASSPIKLG
jgi:hypothetical protein